jgi:uncharacterized protein YpuA (DUF1002 family)
MKRIKILLIAVLTVINAGCATVKETYLEDGRKAYTLNCSGSARGWDKCYSAAGDLCKEAGYEILSRNSEDTSSSFVSGNATRSSGSVSGSSVKTNERSMVIVCKSK